MARCPGQDQRFWKLDDIFEINCPGCGELVEFWKDEPQVKCPSCKNLITNPKLDLGCAKWCKYAKECLGQIAGAESTIMCNKLIEELRDVAGEGHDIVAVGLEVLSFATNIQAEEGGEPLVVKAAAILSGIYSLPDDEKHGGDREGLIKKILVKHGIDSDQSEHICQVINACRENKDIGSIEFKIVSDAQRLSKYNRQVKTESATEINEVWNTVTAEKLAEKMFKS